MEIKHAICFAVSEDRMWNIFQILSQQRYIRPVLKNIPQDAKITRIWHDPLMGSCGILWFRLEHPSFPEVSPVAFPEIREIEWELIDIREEKPEESKSRDILLPPPGGRSNSNLG